MSDAYLEIVELENGEIALQAADVESEPLVSIRFAEVAKDQLSHNHVAVARAMLEAGIKVLGDLSGATVDVSRVVEDDSGRIVH